MKTPEYDAEYLVEPATNVTDHLAAIWWVSDRASGRRLGRVTYAPSHGMYLAEPIVTFSEAPSPIVSVRCCHSLEDAVRALIRERGDRDG